MRSGLALAAVLALLGGCGGEPAPSPSPSRPASATTTPGDVPAPRTLTPADDGARYTMVVGGTSTLRVVDPAAEDPLVTGDAVLVVAVVNVAASGGREWEVRAVAPGESTVTGHDPAYRFTLTVRP